MEPLKFTAASVAKFEDCRFCGEYLYTDTRCTQGCTVELKKNNNTQLQLGIPGQDDVLLYRVDESRFTTSGRGLTEISLLTSEPEAKDMLEIYQGGRKYYYKRIN